MYTFQNAVWKYRTRLSNRSILNLTNRIDHYVIQELKGKAPILDSFHVTK